MPPPDPARKPALRRRCWAALEEAEAARFPGPRGRIPNFKGAEAAAARLAQSEAWAAAGTLKCNPDSPQRKVRHLALQAGKLLFMAVPRLGEEEPFLELDPARLQSGELWEASSIKGAGRLGRARALEDMPPIDLIVTGCVGATRQGARLGKGGGYSDLEYALLRERGLIDARTPVATTVHPAQLLRKGVIPVEPHDQSLDLVVTPARTYRCERPWERPAGILWDRLEEEKRRAIPVLRAGPGEQGAGRPGGARNAGARRDNPR